MHFHPRAGKANHDVTIMMMMRILRMLWMLKATTTPTFCLFYAAGRAPLLGDAASSHLQLSTRVISSPLWINANAISSFFIVFHHQENQCNVISLYNVDKYTYGDFVTWGRVRRYVATDCKFLCSKLRNIFFSSKINSLGNCKGNSPWLSVVVFLQNCFISCQPLGETGAWNGLRWSQEGLWNKMKKSWQSSRLDKT